MPHVLVNNNFWWHGPTFLSDVNLNVNNFDINSECLEARQEFKIHSAFTSVKSDPLLVLSKISKSNQAATVIAYVVRFVHNTKNKEHRLTGNLSFSELNKALKLILKMKQQVKFKNEIRRLRNNCEITANIKYLSPFNDKNGLLRVSGRLENAQTPTSQKYSVILPKNSHISLL